MEDSYFGFNVGKLVVGMLRELKKKGILDEETVMEMLWEAKDPMFPWSKQDIKDLLKL